MAPGKTYVFNERYECKFSYMQEHEWDGANTLFSEWHPFEAANTAVIAEASMQAYDPKEGKYLDALV